MTKKYNAGITSHALWLQEFKLGVSLYLDGKSADEIKAASDEENIFQMTTADRAKRASRNIVRRIPSLPVSVIEIFPHLDISNQKLVALLSMMLTNPLVDDFVYEVYRNEIVFGDRILEPREVRAFFIKKQMENEQVSVWTDKTTRRVMNAVLSILRDAGLLRKPTGNIANGDEVLKPYLSFDLVDVMKETGLTRELAALGG